MGLAGLRHALAVRPVGVRSRFSVLARTPSPRTESETGGDRTSVSSLVEMAK